jgi:hypothetical protein
VPVCPEEAGKLLKKARIRLMDFTCGPMKGFHESSGTAWRADWTGGEIPLFPNELRQLAFVHRVIFVASGFRLTWYTLRVIGATEIGGEGLRE